LVDRRGDISLGASVPFFGVIVFSLSLIEESVGTAIEEIRVFETHVNIKQESFRTESPEILKLGLSLTKGLYMDIIKNKNKIYTR
jgi:hypothetical protein